MKLSAFLLLPILLLAASISAAESFEGDRFSVSLGVFLTDRDTDTQLNGSLGDGTNTDLERDLGLDASDNVFRLDGYYRFNDRHRLDFSVFDLSRASSKQINRDIQWGERLFAIDTVVEANLDLTIYKAAYTYSFLQRDRGYLGATFGVYTADSKVSLAERNLGQAEGRGLTAPLPVIGIRGEYKLSDKWSVRASSEFFFIEFDNIDGSLTDSYAGLDYALFDSVSVGVGFNSVALDVGVSKNDYQGSLDWKYAGGMIFLKFDF